MNKKVPNGHPDNLTNAQLQALQDFKGRIQDIIKPHHDDYYLCKWLKARLFDVKKAEDMYRTSMAYRDKMKLDKLLEEYKPPEVIDKYVTGGFCGYDKAGSPVRVELFGMLDMKGLMVSAKKSDLERSKLLQCEQIVQKWREKTKEHGRRVDGLTVIFDMEHCGTRHMWRPGIQMYLHLVKVLEDNYPEMMKRLMVINAPRIFPILWKIGRPLVSEDMKNKIFVLGSDYSRTLLEFVDADQLPKYLGGTRTDPDGNPRLTTEICQGGEVPSCYFMSENTESEDLEVTKIPQGDKLKIDVKVDKPGTILKWEFRTEDYDIMFGVTLKTDGKDKEVVPMKRFNSHQIAEDDCYTCDEPGLYQVIFDNTYSWTRGKTIHYMIELHYTDMDIDAELDELSTGGSWTRLSKDLQVTHF